MTHVQDGSTSLSSGASSHRGNCDRAVARGLQSVYQVCDQAFHLHGSTSPLARILIIVNTSRSLRSDCVCRLAAELSWNSACVCSSVPFCLSLKIHCCICQRLPLLRETFKEISWSARRFFIMSIVSDVSTSNVTFLLVNVLTRICVSLRRRNTRCNVLSFWML